MADYKNKKTGKLIKVDTFTNFSASVASASDKRVDGRVHEQFKGNDVLKYLPYRIKRGDQAKFFPGLSDGSKDGRIDLDLGIIRDTERKIVYIPISKKNYLHNLAGVGSHISTSFSSSAYLQISAALNAKFANVPDNTVYTFAIEELFNSTTSSFTSSNVQTSSATLTIFESGSGTASFSAIDQHTIGSSSAIYNPDFKLDFDGDFATHWHIRFTDPNSHGDGDMSASAWVEAIEMRFFGPKNNNTGSQFRSHGTAFNGFISRPTSSHLYNADTASAFNSSILNVGLHKYVNGTNDKAGEYAEYTFKSRIAGDSDSGSLYEFPGNNQIIIYPNTARNFITSSTFRYSPGSLTAATTSSITKTLYYYSGSVEGGSMPGLGGIYTGSVASGLYGTPVHSDINLRYNADTGSYSNMAGTMVFAVRKREGSGQQAESGQGPTMVHKS